MTQEDLLKNPQLIFLSKQNISIDSQCVAQLYDLLILSCTKNVRLDYLSCAVNPSCPMKYIFDIYKNISIDYTWLITRKDKWINQLKRTKMIDADLN